MRKISSLLLIWLMSLVSISFWADTGTDSFLVSIFNLIDKWLTYYLVIVAIIWFVILLLQWIKLLSESWMQERMEIKKGMIWTLKILLMILLIPLIFFKVVLWIFGSDWLYKWVWVSTQLEKLNTDLKNKWDQTTD